MNMAKELAKLSYAEKKKVGALLVKDTHIIAEGFNGTPKGFENNCECIAYDSFDGVTDKITKPEVLHAESNAITKVAKSTMSSEGATLYVTLSPCFECAKLIIQAGISKVLYSEVYHDTSGIELLKKTSIIVGRI